MSVSFVKVSLTLAILVITIGCTSRSTGSYPPSTPTSQPEFTEIAKVKVTHTGDIFLNGTKVSLEDLKREFTRLHSVGGAVWYFREAPNQEPTAQAASTIDAVMQAIVDARLPVRLMTQDFAQ